MLRVPVGILAVAIAASWVTASGVGESSGAACPASGGLKFVCGTERPEDLARIPNTRWLIASGFSTGAGLKLIDTEDHSMRRWYSGSPEQHALDEQAYPDCESPPDPSLFNTQGLSLRAAGGSLHTLHVVNHGGRESVEIFTIDATGNEPALRWKGCVLMPQGYAANSVATYSDGTILVTVLTRPGTTITDFWRGAITGGVYEWRPGQAGFQLLPGTQLPGNNGIETSRDDRSFYVVAFGWRSVVVYARDDTSRTLGKAAAPGFMPDNIHWDDGRLITAGMQYDEPACGGIRKIVDGKADDMRCHRGYTVAEFDPVNLQFRIVAYAEPNPDFNGVSAAVIAGTALWLGSYQSDRLATRSLPVPAIQ